MYKIQKLPFNTEVETKAVLKQLSASHRRLAELKGAILSMPNKSILLNTLSLQEAKDSSAIESIITTHDEVYKAELSIPTTPAAKEVQSYSRAMNYGFDLVKRHNLITCNDLIKISQEIKHNDSGFRTTTGTALVNDRTQEIVYEPPQNYDDIVEYMANLERFINDDTISDLDPLIKMCIIHHQFESIHPFYDGNGRTGRILNILYLVKEGLLDMPVLYLSRYITKNKGSYYQLLQNVRTNNDWEEWILFMLKGIELTSIETVDLVLNIKDMMMSYKQRIRSEFPKIYSQDLLNNIFKHPYTKIDFVCRDLNVTRPTATRYLTVLTEAKILDVMKLGRDNFYLNIELYQLLMNAFH